MIRGLRYAATRYNHGKRSAPSKTNDPAKEAIVDGTAIPKAQVGTIREDWYDSVNSLDEMVDAIRNVIGGDAFRWKLFLRKVLDFIQYRAEKKDPVEFISVYSYEDHRIQSIGARIDDVCDYLAGTKKSESADMEIELKRGLYCNITVHRPFGRSIKEGEEYLYDPSPRRTPQEIAQRRKENRLDKLTRTVTIRDEEGRLKTVSM